MTKITHFKKYTFLVIVFAFFINYSFSQKDENKCKVLLQEISASYDGGCKDGLAHGKGIAKGVDEYKGRFKKGLPHGAGKYIWKDGSYYEGNWKEGKKSGKGKMYNPLTKKEILGIWKEDNFFKEITERPYEIIRQYGITGVSIQEKTTATLGSVEIVFVRDGSESRTIGGLVINSSSGVIKTSNYFTGFENVIFPFEGSVEFRAMNRFNTVLLKYELKFKINKKSSWIIRIRY